MIRLHNEVILYTTGCPKCRILKMKLDNADVRYRENTDVEEMSRLGLLSAPALGVDGEILEFAAACKWADGQKE